MDGACRELRGKQVLRKHSPCLFGLLGQVEEYADTRSAVSEQIRNRGGLCACWLLLE